MNDNPKLRKNGGDGTFFGNLWRTVVKNNIPLGETIVDAIDKKDVGKIFESISNDGQLTEEQKEILLANLKQDVTEMEEVTKRWQSDMLSDSWLSKNIRPLSLAFLTLALFLYIILDSAIEGFKINEAWIDLLSSLLLLVYGGYYGARAVEKVTHIRSVGKNEK